MKVTNFKLCRIGNLIGVQTKEYKYKIGQIIYVKSGKIKILEQTRIYNKNNQSEKAYTYQCLNCNSIYTVREHSIIDNNGCVKCSDGVSYPEKFMLNILKQLNIKFKYQKTFKWSKRYRYDFYIPNLNIIIEVHGGQHEQGHGFLKNTSRNEEYITDQIKEELAIKNKINKYIIIDAKKSTLNYMKISIIKNLSEIYNLNNVNWIQAHQNACCSNIKLASDLWNSGFSTKDISDKLNISQSAIINYLKQGTDAKWCNYNSIESRSRVVRISVNQKRVRCKNTGEEFESITQATKAYNIYRTGVSDCCAGRIPSAGKHPITKESLLWEYC